MLREAVASVLAQTYRPIEVIVVDDGSTDETRSIADDLASAHTEVMALHRPNGGAGAARETGRLAARGEFIQHLDSDDLLLPRKFQLQVAGLREAPGAGASYGWTRLRNPDGTAMPEPWKRSGERIPTMFPAMLQSRWWDTPTPLFRASLIEAAGPWLPLRIEEDWEYDARIASQGITLHYCADWVCEVRVHDAGHASGSGLVPERLQDRATAHAAILAHARRAGISTDTPEMRHFARELFLLARQCGAAGLSRESGQLFHLARQASGNHGRPQFLAYRAVVSVVGWRGAGWISAFLDGLRSRLKAESGPRRSSAGARR